LKHLKNNFKLHKLKIVVSECCLHLSTKTTKYIWIIAWNWSTLINITI